MWWQDKISPKHNIDGMVREELRRLGYTGGQNVSRRDFHTALGFVCHRLLEHDTGTGANSTAILKY